MSNSSVYILIEGEQRGPYDLSQIRAMSESGAVTADTPFWQEGMTEWQPLSTIAHELEAVVPEDANHALPMQEASGSDVPIPAKEEEFEAFSTGQTERPAFVQRVNSSKALEIIRDGLTYPLMKRWTWWILVTGSAALVFTVARGIYTIFFLFGVVVRCYFSVIETTLTGYGTQKWQGSGLNMEGLWGSVARALGVAALSWSPAIAAGIILLQHNQSPEPWFSILGAVGCEYFSMAALGTVAFGSFSGAWPHLVIPAVMRSGATYSLAALALMLVPWSFTWTVSILTSTFGMWGVVLSCAVAAYFLIAQARITGLIYLANKEEIGWE